MKNLLILFVFLLTYTIHAQDKYLTKSGLLVFEASVPSFEEVKAKNESATVILNTENGEIAALVLVRGFRFKNALMEEHFNENYAETELYPKATFKGVIKDYTSLNLENLVEQKVSIDGVLDFHGQSKQISNILVNITSDTDLITLHGSFIVLASDFQIEIPKIVSNKLSNEVLVTFNFELNKK